MASRTKETSTGEGRCGLRCGLASLLGALLLAGAPSTAAAYRTLAAEEPGVRGEIGWSATALVSFELGPELPADEARVFEAELASAIAAWNAAPCAPVVLALADRSAPAFADIRVRLEPDWAERGFDSDAAGTTEVSLELLPDGRARISAAWIDLNGTFAWGAHPQRLSGPARDIRAVLTHELGHALGLLHVCGEDTPVRCRPAHEETAMYPLYRGAPQATLSGDDVAGLCAIYGGAGTIDPVGPAEVSCGDDAACAVGQWCIEAVCQRDMRFGQACDSETSCIGARCVAHGEAGVCTYVCETDEECPGQTRCARVLGSDERVCAPSGGGAGCAVTPTSGPSLAPLSVAGLFGLLLLLRTRRRSALWLLTAGTLALVGACGGEPDPVDASRVDAGRVDAEVRVDAGPVDGGGGVDAGFDAGPPPEACDTPGATRTAECGFCGTGAQTCSDANVWELTSACLMQGECAEGVTEDQSLALCQQQQRICLTGCTWTAWEDVGGPGVCEAGETRRAADGTCPAGETLEERCADDCSGWEPVGVCANPCGVTPRTTPEYAAEVCIPAGPFIRGSETYPDTRPVAEVYVSAYLIDAYPVTNLRYSECVDAGACTLTSSTQALRAYERSSLAGFSAYGLARSQAIAFCAWDGGRRLPTEAEWEKAVRGPAPRTNPYPWDGDEYSCDLLRDRDCPEYRTVSRAPQRSWDHPLVDGTRSYYGTFLQYGNWFEPASDAYDSRYYEEPESLSDPTGPPRATGDYVVRGRPFMDVREELTYRAQSLLVNNGFVIRCARSAE